VKHPAVFDAVVVGTPSERWGQQVTALVQLREGREISVEDLRAHCRTLIADYKTPKAVFFVDSVPRTPVGKADYSQAQAAALRLLGPPEG
jgi:acyl-CoA synthetase (AMP-forming)/AMP-acid ligase II